MQEAARARAARDYRKADALQKTIVDAGYRVINGPNGEETLARKYRIRLRECENAYEHCFDFFSSCFLYYIEGV